MEKNFITDEYSFDERQSSYYLDAARYLGLAEESLDIDGHDCYTLTKLGKSLFSMSYKQRQLKLIESILSYKSFNLTYKAYCKSNKRISDREIAEFIKRLVLLIRKQDYHIARLLISVELVQYVLGFIGFLILLIIRYNTLFDRIGPSHMMWGPIFISIKVFL